MIKAYSIDHQLTKEFRPYLEPITGDRPIALLVSADRTSIILQNTDTNFILGEAYFDHQPQTDPVAQLLLTTCLLIKAIAVHHFKDYGKSFKYTGLPPGTKPKTH